MAYVLECTIRPTSYTPINTDQLNTITRFTFVNKVVIENDVCAARVLSCWSTFRHFLDAYALMIFENTQAILSLEWMSIVISLRQYGGRRRKVGCGCSCITVFA